MLPGLAMPLTMNDPAAYKIPAGPLWSGGGEFREQPLVVPTQRMSFTEAVINADNVLSAWASLLSQQLKASPRRRYKCFLEA